MTTTESKLLDQQAVEEILARKWEWTYAEPHNQQTVRITVAERDALCATVKHLRAENERLTESLSKTNTLGEEMLTRMENVAGIGRSADHGWYYVIERVESRLAQVEKEREYWRTRATEADKAAEKWYHERY